MEEKKKERQEKKGKKKEKKNEIQLLLDRTNAHDHMSRESSRYRSCD